MMNLLPEENKIAMRREYVRRLAVIAGSFSAAIFFSALLFLLLLSFNLEKDKAIYAENARLSKEKTASEEDKNLFSLMNEANAKIFYFEKNERASRDFSANLEKIIRLKTNGISILSISCVYGGDGKSAAVELSGVSVSRKELLDFEDSLKSQQDFGEVSLPLSGFLKSEDIDFDVRFKIYEK